MVHELHGRGRMISTLLHTCTRIPIHHTFACYTQIQYVVFTLALCPYDYFGCVNINKCSLFVYLYGFAAIIIAKVTRL